MGFRSPHVLVRQQDDTHWVLEEDLVYRGRDEEFVVPRGTRTDFASVPRVFAWLVPKYGRYTAAAVLHDRLCATEVPAGDVTPIDADGLFRRSMRELGVPFLRRWLMWAAVRWGALTVADRRRGWLRELPRTLLVTAVALPVVALPAVTILAALLVFALFEAVAYVLLRLAGTRAAPVDRPRKEVNSPDGIDLTT